MENSPNSQNTPHDGVYWEVFLIARKFDWSGKWLKWRPTNWGHAWVALVAFEKDHSQMNWLQNKAYEIRHKFWPQKYSGQYDSPEFYKLSDKHDIRTYSRWTDGWHYNNRLDVDGTRKIIETGRIDFLDVAVRKFRLDADKVEWVSKIAIDPRQTGCGTEKYGFWCLCTTYAGNLWNRITGEKLRLPPTPNNTVNFINSLNHKNGSIYFDQKQAST